jgi:hypothetical protein
MHRPAVHAAVEGGWEEHAFAHPPQLPLSACSSTHVPAHRVNPDGHTHWPFWQVVPPLQTSQVDPTPSFEPSSVEAPAPSRTIAVASSIPASDPVSVRDEPPPSGTPASTLESTVTCVRQPGKTTAAASPMRKA